MSELRETIARAIYSATYAKPGANYPTEPEEQADAAIRAFAEAIRRPEVIVAAGEAYDANDWMDGYGAIGAAINAALATLGVQEGDKEA